MDSFQFFFLRLFKISFFSFLTAYQTLPPWKKVLTRAGGERGNVAIWYKASKNVLV